MNLDLASAGFGNLCNDFETIHAILYAHGMYALFDLTTLLITFRPA